MVRTQCFHCRGSGSFPDWGTEDPASFVVRPKKKKKSFVKSQIAVK